MATLTCTCCGADVTMPQYHNGNVYGYTCIKKVAPKAKRTKVTYSALDSDSVKVSGVAGTVRVNVRVKLSSGDVLNGIGYMNMKEYESGDTFTSVLKVLNDKAQYSFLCTENGFYLSDKPV